MLVIDDHLRLLVPENEMEPYDRFLEHHGLCKGYQSGEQLIAAMNKDGVNVGVLLHGNNEHRLAMVDQYPKRLVAFAGVQMRALNDDPEATLGNIRRLIARGCRGIGELRLFSEGYGVDNPSLHALIGVAIELDVPIHFECTSTVGEYYPGRIGTMLYDFERLANLYPKLKMILSSWGGGLCLFEMMPELPEKLKNVYYSTGSPVDDFNVGVMLRTVPRVCYPRKILYGSAAPIRSRQIDVYTGSAAPREVIQAILGLNIALLLGLNLNELGSP